MSGTSQRSIEKLPLSVRDNLWAFRGDCSSSGAISWWLGLKGEPLLIDCPEVTQPNIDVLKKLSRNVKPKILLTSREGHGRISLLQSKLGWPVLMHEEEAYLLPGLSEVQTFSEEFTTDSGVRLLWTPGPTPGSCVAHVKEPWNVLFCGRLLVPVEVDRLAPFQCRKTFHWNRQRKSLKKLRHWIPPNPLPSLALGAGIGHYDCAKLFAWEAWKAPYAGHEPMFF